MWVKTPIFLTDFDPYVSPITKRPAKTSMVLHPNRAASRAPRGTKPRTNGRGADAQRNDPEP